MPTRTVLVIEDDPAIRRGIVDALRYANFGVCECSDGARAAAMAIESAIDLVLLDVMLPGRDGFSILEELRAAKPTLPVIMVTARGAESDRVRGLNVGADDYVVKPFSAKELLARVEAVLRRSPERPSDVHTLRCNGCVIDLERREIAHERAATSPSERAATSSSRVGAPVNDDQSRREDAAARCTLSEREADILRYLASNRGRAVDRDELLQRVWGLDPRNLETRTVDMHIARLREKVGEECIQTVRGKGYMLAQAVKSE